MNLKSRNGIAAAAMCIAAGLAGCGDAVSAVPSAARVDETPSQIQEGRTQMRLDRLDHLVLTVADLDVTIDFYTRVLGMKSVTFGAGRKALKFGHSKINLHEAGNEFEPKSKRPTPGSADLCFIVDQPLDDVVAELERHDVPIEQGPIQRTGATGPINSVYIRDPDGNLLEISNYL